MSRWRLMSSAPTHMGAKADLYVPSPATVEEWRELAFTGRITGCSFSTAFDPPTWGKTLYGPERFVKIKGATHWMPVPARPGKRRPHQPERRRRSQGQAENQKGKARP